VTQDVCTRLAEGYEAVGVALLEVLNAETELHHAFIVYWG